MVAQPRLFSHLPPRPRLTGMRDRIHAALDVLLPRRAGKGLTGSLWKTTIRRPDVGRRRRVPAACAHGDSRRRFRAKQSRYVPIKRGMLDSSPGTWCVAPTIVDVIPVVISGALGGTADGQIPSLEAHLRCGFCKRFIVLGPAP